MMNKKTDRTAQLTGVYIMATAAYAILYAVTSSNILTIVFFIALMIVEILLISKKRSEDVFAIALLLIPLMGILTYNKIPLLNIYIATTVLLIITNKKYIINKKLLSIVLLIVVVDVIKVLLFFNNINDAASLISIPLFYISAIGGIVLYESRPSRHKIDKYFSFFIAGTTISALYGIITRFIAGGITYALINTKIETRNMAASGDPNYFGLYILLSVSFILLITISKKRNYIRNIIFSLILIAIGLTSASRMYYIMLALIVGLLAYTIINGLATKKWLSSLVIIIAIIAIIYILKNIIIENIGFIFSRFNDADLSNGRNGLRNSYLATLSDNPVSELIGIGIPKYNIRSGIMIYAHNLYIELFVCTGIIGCIIATILFIKIAILYAASRKKIMYFPLLLILISGLSLNFIEVDSFYLIAALLFSNIRLDRTKSNHITIPRGTNEEITK